MLLGKICSEISCKIIHRQLNNSQVDPGALTDEYDNMLARLNGKVINCAIYPSPRPSRERGNPVRAGPPSFTYFSLKRF